MLLRKYTVRRPAGNMLFTPADGGAGAEYDTRRCIHCMAQWAHIPNSGIKRGYCSHCQGDLCGQPECFICYHYEQQLHDWETHGHLLTPKHEGIKQGNIVVP